MKSKIILDPLWLTKGKYFDPEYFNYILLDASLKYKQEIAECRADSFYEVFFHMLNLNNLAVNGSLFTSKFKPICNNARVEEIARELKKLYSLSEDTAEIFKNANFVFLNILLEYMSLHLEVLEHTRLFYVNPRIHFEKEIFIMINQMDSSKYIIWKLTDDAKKDFGYSFTSVKKVDVPRKDEHTFREKFEDPKLENISSSKNLIFATLEKEDDPKLVASTIKDIILLNRGMTKTHTFEPLVIGELYRYMWLEKMLPFTLDQWKS